MVKTFGLTHIGLAVRDAERSYQFYRAVFGVEEYYRVEGEIQAKTPGAHDVIAFDQNAANPGVRGGISHIGFRLQSAADIDAAVEAVERAGGTVLRKGDFCPGCPYAFVTDPDGYEIEIWFE